MQEIGLGCQDETISFENVATLLQLVPLMAPFLALRCTAGVGGVEGRNALSGS